MSNSVKRVIRERHRYREFGQKLENYGPFGEARGHRRTSEPQAEGRSSQV